MTEFLIAYKHELLLLLSFIYVPFLAFVVSLGVVYLFGRMLELAKKDVTKNILAFLSMEGVYLFYFFKYDVAFSLTQRIWYIIIYSAISIILYVLIGFTLYIRVEALLDKLAAPKVKKKK